MNKPNPLNWRSIETAPNNVVVWTKIHDAEGERNVTQLTRQNGLWFFPDFSMYVYYSPTHWQHI